MRSCPRCGKTYPDSEVFCEDDGTALVQAAAAGRATTVMPESGGAPASTPAECPTCGGKAEPGEVICNFCGTRLVPEGAQPAPSQPPTGAPTQRTHDPQAFVPASEWISSGMTRGGDASQSGATPPEGDDGEGAGGRGAAGIIGYALAAIIALGAGAWLALHFTEHHPRAPIAQASASPTPGLITGPSVQLASSIPIEVSGGANVPGRDTGAMAQAFAKNKAGLLDTYTHALAANAKLEDGMIVRLHIMPDGSVSSGTVRVSTAGDPGLDAAVIKTMNAWDFTPASGGGAVDADFPVIFANQPADVATLSSDLGTKLAKLSPDEAPEFSSALPSPGPTTELAAVPSVVPTPMAAPPPAIAKRPERRRHEMASARPRRPAIPPLIDRVKDELRANRRFRRVQAYTKGGTVTLFGKAFDDQDKAAAQREVASVSGVTSVINNIVTDTSQWTHYQNQINSELQNAGFNQVSAKVIGKDCYLNGQVTSDLDRQRAVTIAERAAPVTVRVNLIRVVPGSMF